MSTGNLVRRAGLARTALSRLVDQHGLQLYGVVHQTLHSIWTKGDCWPHMGLAISGGVDSMALARLCADITNTSGSSPFEPVLEAMGAPGSMPVSLRGFIVNHNARRNSDREAEEVAKEPVKMGIQPEILHLDWSAHGDPTSLPNFESVARTLRYQALGEACARRGIQELIVAHHADDQAETMILRLLGGYLGAGLTGMRAIAPIPECYGMYGVYHSGRSYAESSGSHYGMPNEGGGVQIVRPLLSVRKAELIGVCEQRGVRWFEDHTNSNPTITPRNTVRHLLRNDFLPKALRASRWEHFHRMAGRRRRQHEWTVRDALRNMSWKLDVRTSTVTTTIPESVISETAKDHFTQAVLLRQLIETVSPKEIVELKNVLAISDDIFNPMKESLSRQAGGVSVRRSNTRELKLHRAMPTALEREDVRKTLWPASPDWGWSRLQLWDGRYWIRISAPRDHIEAKRRIVVRFFTKGDLAALRIGMNKEQRADLEHALAPAKGDMRFTIPAIVSKDGGQTSRVVVLPSLGWCAPGWARDGENADDTKWRFDIRYRRVALESEQDSELEQMM